MVADWEYSYNGLTFGGNQAIGVLSVQGLDPPDIREDIVIKSGRHGAYVYANLYDPRRILIELDITGATADDTFTNLNALKLAMAPRLFESALVFKWPGQVEMQSRCVPSRIAYPVDRDLAIGLGNAQLEMLAGDPLLYSNAQSQQLNVAPAGTFVAANAGITPTDPFSVTFEGPGTTFTVKDNAVGTKKLQINHTLTAGQLITVDWRARTIFQSNGTNLYDKLSADSLWWQLDPGNTTVAFTVGSGSTGATNMDFTWRSAWV